MFSLPSSLFSTICYFFQHQTVTCRRRRGCHRVICLPRRLTANWLAKLRNSRERVIQTFKSCINEFYQFIFMRREHKISLRLSDKLLYAVCYWIFLLRTINLLKHSSFNSNNSNIALCQSYDRCNTIEGCTRHEERPNGTRRRLGSSWSRLILFLTLFRFLCYSLRSSFTMTSRCPARVRNCGRRPR